MARRWRGATRAFPGVQADVVVIVASSKKGGLITIVLLDPETQHSGLKGNGAIKVGDLEVDMTDAGRGVNGGHWDLLCIDTSIRRRNGQTSCHCAQILRKKSPRTGGGPGASATGTQL
jgi:hypothetical protein